MNELLEKLYAQHHLTREEMQLIATKMLDGTLSDLQISAVLIALKIKTITPSELTGLVTVMQQHAIALSDVPFSLMDNCGTGGDHLKTFNISTLTAFVLAAGGIKMAKHGNKSVSSRSGSADLLASFDLEFTNDPMLIEYQLKTAGITFLYAPAFHPMMKTVAPIRTALNTPTIFNLLGPLLNPYPLDTQLMGTFDPHSLDLLRDTLIQLGRKQVTIVHGALGMDEANLAGRTTCLLYRNGVKDMITFTPEEMGFKPSPIQAIQVDSIKQSHEQTLAILRNEASVALDTVCLNAGLGFFTANKVPSIQAGIQFAQQLLRDGAVYDTFTRLLHTQQEVYA